MARWVVLNRGKRKASSQLKCLDCGWKWRSKCKYVVRLRDWQERCRRGMTDQMILDRLRDGTLTIDAETAEVRSFYKKWTVLQQLKSHHGKDGYRFVRVCKMGRKKAIAVHRLQWMACHDCLIPEGYDVHHKRSPPRPSPKPNNIGNLELIESMENQRVGISPGWDDEVPF